VLIHAFPALLGLIAAPRQARFPPLVAQARIPQQVPPRALIAKLESSLRVVVQMHAIHVLQAAREITDPTPQSLLIVKHVTQDTTHPLTALLNALSVKMAIGQIRAKRNAPHVPPALTKILIAVLIVSMDSTLPSQLPPHALIAPLDTFLSQQIRPLLSALLVFLELTMLKQNRFNALPVLWPPGAQPKALAPQHASIVCQDLFRL